jgi:ribosomal protein S18 acetylase RimI-like enzyme
VDDGFEPIARWWRALDDLFQRVEPMWWGAVVSDERFPRVQEANYARVDTRQPVGLGEIEEELVPAMRRSALGRTHVVVFHPDEQTDLLVEASSRGERLAWDLVMQHTGAPPAPDVPVEPIAVGDEGFDAMFRRSMTSFGIDDPAVVDEISALEDAVMVPAGRRWFCVREGGAPVALAGLLELEGVGCVDHVVTLPHARRRGYATALACAAVAAARASDAERTYLLAEPEGDAVRLYERIGFRRVTQIASWITASP